MLRYNTAYILIKPHITLKNFRPEPDNSEAFIIDISDLSIEKVIIVLFENVYRKSEASCGTWTSITDESHPLDLAGPNWNLWPTH